MPSHRIPRVAEAIREVVSSAILFELADPRVQGVTVLRAEVTGDLRNATVYVTVMGNEAQQRLALRGLQHASGFIQGKVARRLQTRYTPTLCFKRDDSVKNSVAISRLIDEAIAEDLKAHHSDSEVGVSATDDTDNPTDEIDHDAEALPPGSPDG